MFKHAIVFFNFYLCIVSISFYPGCKFKHVHELVQAEPRHAEVLGHLLFAAKLVAEKEGIVDGFRVVINNGPEACKSLQSFFTDC